MLLLIRFSLIWSVQCFPPHQDQPELFKHLQILISTLSTGGETFCQTGRHLAAHQRRGRWDEGHSLPGLTMPTLEEKLYWVYCVLLPLPLPPFVVVAVESWSPPLFKPISQAPTTAVCSTVQSWVGATNKGSQVEYSERGELYN